MIDNEIQKLRLLLQTDEILTPESPDFIANSQPFAKQKDLGTKVVVRPRSLDSLSKAVKFLADSNLDFKVRSAGFGSASARDVILSMSAFDQFEFSAEREELVLGVGQTWMDYYTKMEKVAPEYSVVAVRTPALGVGGSVLAGGFSWLSSEYGCLSDPQNLLDIQLVKLDGTVLWASEGPELLWAMRATGGAFAVAVAFKLRCYKYPQKVWSGPILLPNTAEVKKQICEGIISMDLKDLDPKVAMFLYRMAPEILKAIGDGVNGNVIVVHAYDARGEESGRRKFEWALKVPGVIDRTQLMTRRQLAQLQEAVGEMKYTQDIYWNPIGLPKLTEQIIMNAFAWYDKTQNTGDPSLAFCSSMLFELWCTSDSKSGRLASAWPRPPGLRHMVLLASGSFAPGPGSDAARELVKMGPKEILEPGEKLHVFTNALEDFHDMRDVYGENYDKLVELRKKYDPLNRLKGPFTD